MCPSCAVGKFGDVVGEKNCKLCPTGWIRNGNHGFTRCKICIGGTNTRNLKGASLCTNCNVGQYGASSGVCDVCKAGMYGDMPGETFCLPCSADTYYDGTAATSHAQCKLCSLGRTTSGGTNQKTASACVCRSQPSLQAPAGYYTSSNQTCSLCPDGADCFLKDDAKLSELVPLNGYWQPNASIPFFVDCSLVRADDAKERCCPLLASKFIKEEEIDEGCLCQDEWRYDIAGARNGRSIYYGCAETEDWPGNHWCYINSNETDRCPDSSKSVYVEETRRYKVCEIKQEKSWFNNATICTILDPENATQTGVQCKLGFSGTL